MKRKYVYCVMWQGNKTRGLTEIVRLAPLKTMRDLKALNTYLEKYEKDESLVITNWKYLGRKCPEIEDPTP